MTRILGGTLLACLLITMSGAHAQGTKPIRFLVPFAPGGATDAFARVVAQQMTDHGGPQVLVENRPGAGTTIAGDAVVKSATDGTTLFFTDIPTHAISVSLFAKLPYDPIKDFAPVALVSNSPLMLVAHPSLNIQSIGQLIERARAEPGKLTYGSAGNGTITHLSGESIKMMAKVDLVHVPFKGGNSSVASVLAGDIALSIITIPAALPHIRSGKMVGVGVTSAKRIPQAPNVSAIAEAVPGYETALRIGVLARAGTPAETVARLNAEINRALDGAKVKEVFAANAADAMKVSPAEFAIMLEHEVRNWAAVVKASGAKAE
ncbi:MAG: tripartite tricarboxylate transporter substrate binding protein [Burkholderiales bacterium]